MMESELRAHERVAAVLEENAIEPTVIGGLAPSFSAAARFPRRMLRTSHRTGRTRRSSRA
jgi:hypothetical protein